jgi:DNA mismatch repair protein PMS2
MIGLKHYTSKLSTFDDLSTVRTFGLRGEAISSLCALCESVVVTTATQGPMGTQLDLEQSGTLGKKTKIARQASRSISPVFCL